MSAESVSWRMDLSLAPGACGYRPTLEGVFASDSSVCDAVLICPGGGYVMTAEHEKYPVAEAFARAGLHAFILTYSVAPCRYPTQLLELARALRLVRSQSDKLRVNPSRIAVLGFSAGGHLAASLATLHGESVIACQENAAISARPDASILCYPVISSGAWGHAESFQHLLGDQANGPLLKELSLEHRVSKSTPPTFLWHTADDTVVPVENSLLYAQALRSAGVSFELHCFERGVHGLGLATGEPGVLAWFDLCVRWLRGVGFRVGTSQ